MRKVVCVSYMQEYKTEAFLTSERGFLVKEKKGKTDEESVAERIQYTRQTDGWSACPLGSKWYEA